MMCTQDHSVVKVFSLDSKSAGDTTPHHTTPHHTTPHHTATKTFALRLRMLRSRVRAQPADTHPRWYLGNERRLRGTSDWHFRRWSGRSVTKNLTASCTHGPLFESAKCSKRQLAYAKNIQNASISLTASGQYAHLGRRGLQGGSPVSNEGQALSLGLQQ